MTAIFNQLDEQALMKKAPSVFASSAHEERSERYGFIPTIECVRALQRAGFYPVYAGQSNCRSEEKKNHCRHVMRFRHHGTDHSRQVGNLSEIVLVNSHDGTTSYQLRAGVYRLVCSNGLIAGDDHFKRNVRHSGDVISKVVEAATDLIEIVPEAMQMVEYWKGIELSKDHKRVFAETAATLKWDEDSIPVTAEQILRPKRYDDNKNDLWTTFNVIQENVIKGGIRYNDKETYERRSTRAVNSISENTRLNTALWSLTSKMAELLN